MCFKEKFQTFFCVKLLFSQSGFPFGKQFEILKRLFFRKLMLVRSLYSFRQNFVNCVFYKGLKIRNGEINWN